MSYGNKKTPGKEIWGTTTFRIDINTSKRTFDGEFAGEVILYERRWEHSRVMFATDKEFIDALKELWKTSVKRGSIQDARLARWVEEYFNEKNIQATYENILKSIKGEAVNTEVEQVTHDLIHTALSSEKKLEKEETIALAAASDDIIPTGIIIQIEGEYDADTITDSLLPTLLEKHKPAREKQISSSSSFFDENGKRREIETKLNISENVTAGNSKVQSGLANTFGFAIRDVEIEDIIPYSYIVDDVGVIGGNAEKIGEEITDAGLKVSWKIPTLKPDEEVEIDYYLGSRLMRTIVMQSKATVNVINTYEPIQKADNRLFATPLFVNNKNEVLLKVKVMDQIPREMKIRGSSPNLNEALDQLSSPDSTEIYWEYTDIPPKEKHQIHYDLEMQPYLLRDVYDIFGEDQTTPIAKISKITKPLAMQSGFGIIFGIEILQDIHDPIVIRDILSKSVEVQTVESENGTLAIAETTDEKIVSWAIETYEPREIYHAFLRYKPSETLNPSLLKVKLSNKEAKLNSAYKTLRKADAVVLPYSYHAKVDIRRS